MTELDSGPSAELMPVLLEAGSAELVADIQENGQRQPAIESDLIIARIEKARQLLAEAKDVPSAKKLVDMAHAAEVFAKRQRLSQDCIDDAHAIKVDAMRLLGEHLDRTEKHKGGNPNLTSSKKEQVEEPPTYADVGISRKEASDAQAVARIAAKKNALYEKIRSNEMSVPKARREIARLEAMATLPEMTPHREAPEDPSRRWHPAMRGFCKFINSTNDGGGVKKLTAEWPRYVKTQFTEELRQIIRELQEWVIELG